jgi:hypothetical protein
METRVIEVESLELGELERRLVRARRTAFVARFIVLRESKRSRAHRVIEGMCWDDITTVEELAQRFREAFLENGDLMPSVDRDLRRAMAHTHRPLRYLVDEYSKRATRSFLDALEDYSRSNTILFASDDVSHPPFGGWRLPSEVKQAIAEAVAAADQSAPADQSGNESK